HLLTPEDGGAYLALRAASRMWELPSWQSYYDLTPADWPALREAVRDALAWQGDMSFGAPRDGHATFQALDGNPRWAGIPDLDEAGALAVEAYFRTYGPATPEHVRYWLGEGLGAGRKRIRSWIAGLGDRLAEVDVDSAPAYVLREDLDDLAATRATGAVRLLPGYDQWVLGPGTADTHVVPRARRPLVSRQANLVVAGGVVSGTWSATGDELAVSWFAEAGPAPRDALADEVARLAPILGRPREPVIRTD